jgi:hypothetical protein
MPAESCIDPHIGGERSVRPELRHLAERQHGVVSRTQLLAIGLSPRAVDGRVARGWLIPLHRGVYAVGHRPLAMRGHLLAAALAAGSEAVVSHRAAAQLWRLLAGPATATADASPVVDVTVPTSRRGSARVRIHRSRLRSDERGRIARIPVTSLSRTLLDLAAVIEREPLEEAINQARVSRLTDRLSLHELIERHPGRRGVAALRAILGGEAMAVGITKSALEQRFAALIRRAGIPAPRRNEPIEAGGRFFEVDCAWPSGRLLVELDGQAVHGTKRAFESDRERDRLLVAAGWRVVRVTWRQLRGEPERIVADLRALLTPTLRS